MYFAQPSFCIFEWCVSLTIRSPVPPITHPIPYGLLFKISRGFLSTHYLLSGSNGLFLGLSFIMAAFITSLINFYKTVLFFYFFGTLIQNSHNLFVNDSRKQQLPECRLLLQNQIFLQKYMLDPESDRLIQKEGNMSREILVKF